MVKFLSIVALLFLISCSSTNLELTGDIDENQFISHSGNLQKILSESAPKAEYALIIGIDGTAVLLTERSFNEVEIQQIKGNWISSVIDLPPVCNIKNIAEICLYQPNFSDSEKLDSFSRIISEFEFLGESSRSDQFVRKYKRKEN